MPGQQHNDHEKHIKAVVLDRDGVLIGDRTDFNFPLPHPKVQQKLSHLRMAPKYFDHFIG